MARPAYNPEKRTAIEADICAKALNLFEHSGYRSVSMRAIADELGWSATALYRYFANKEANYLLKVRVEVVNQPY